MDKYFLFSSGENLIIVLNPITGSTKVWDYTNPLVPVEVTTLTEEAKNAISFFLFKVLPQKGMCINLDLISRDKEVIEKGFNLNDRFMKLKEEGELAQIENNIKQMEGGIPSLIDFPPSSGRVS